MTTVLDNLTIYQTTIYHLLSTIYYLPSTIYYLLSASFDLLLGNFGAVSFQDYVVACGIKGNAGHKRPH